MHEIQTKPTSPTDESSGADGQVATDAGIDPNVSRRRLVDIRCGFAELALQEAEAAEARVEEARQACMEQDAAVAAARAAVDGSGSAAVKEQAHRAFRASSSAARERSQVETAASVWLAEINRANGVLTAGKQRVKHEAELAEGLRGQLDHLIATAETSRAMADAAFEACRSAQAELAASEAAPAPEVAVAMGAASVPIAAGSATALQAPTEERAGSATVPASSTGLASEPSTARSSGKTFDATRTAMSAASAAALLKPVPVAARKEPPSDGLIVDLSAAHPQLIVRLLRRDGAAMTMLVDRLASDPAGRSCWQFLLSNFVDSVAAAAIDEGFFDFPAGNPFWDLFTRDEARDVARGLAALGFRHDGLSGFVDGRVPGQRDLALAVGQAGMNPVRIRFWPHPEAAAELFKDARVSVDLFVAARAPSLTMGELVQLLGRRAEMLADLWNDWPRVRPLLFSSIGG
jgi:hypothetical protein